MVVLHGSHWVGAVALEPDRGAIVFGTARLGCFPNLTRAFEHWLPRSTRVRAQAVMWMSARWGGAITPLLVMFVLQWVDWRTAFLLFGLLGVVWAVVFTLWFRDNPREHPSVNAAEAAMLPSPQDVMATQHFAVPWGKILRSPTVWMLCGQYFACSYAFYFLVTWFPRYLRDVHNYDLSVQSALLAGLPLFLGGCGSMLTGIFTPWVQRVTGSVALARRLIGTLGFLGAAVCLVLSTQMTNPYWAVGVIAFASLCNDLTCAWGMGQLHGCGWAVCGYHRWSDEHGGQHWRLSLTYRAGVRRRRPATETHLLYHSRHVSFRGTLLVVHGPDHSSRKIRRRTHLTMITLYHTQSGIVLEREGKRVTAPASFTLDALFCSEMPADLAVEAFHAGVGSASVDTLLAPLQSQEVWAAGVTYLRSKTARMEESKDAGGGTFYDRVYEAERPEMFFKATPHRVVGPGTVRIRRDSKWNVPEPELALAINTAGNIFGYTIGNDMSSRDIEGENPLYLPQAKVYDGSAALGPCLVVTDPLPAPTTVIAIEIRRGGHGRLRRRDHRRADQAAAPRSPTGSSARTRFRTAASS